MNNYQFKQKTEIFFGPKSRFQLGKHLKTKAKKVLFLYGQNSIFTTGLYDEIINQLKTNNIEYIELGGVVPNPLLSKVKEGIKLCHEFDVDFILAVGGGSVIDTAKAIGAGTKYDGDVWDFFTNKATLKDSLEVGVVLTLSATGSEANHRCVITNDDNLYKRGSSLVVPCFAFLDPELLLTLPHYQIKCGIMDTFSHLVERLFTNTKHVEVTNNQIRAAMKSLVELTPQLLTTKDVNVLGEFMYLSMLAHNFSLCVGRQTDWASHNIEHELSGLYNVTHAQGLAVIMPAWMQYVYRHDPMQFQKFGEVFNLKASNDTNKDAQAAINAFKKYINEIGFECTLASLGLDHIDYALVASQCTQGTLGNFVNLNYDDVINILKLSE